MCDSGVSVRVRPEESTSARRSRSSREGCVRACDVDGLASNARARRSQNARRTSPRLSAQDFPRLWWTSTVPRAQTVWKKHKFDSDGKDTPDSGNLAEVELCDDNSRRAPDIPPRTDQIVAAFAREDIGTGVSEAIARHPTVDCEVRLSLSRAGLFPLPSPRAGTRAKKLPAGKTRQFCLRGYGNPRRRRDDARLVVADPSRPDPPLRHASVRSTQKRGKGNMAVRIPVLAPARAPPSPHLRAVTSPPSAGEDRRC